MSVLILLKIILDWEKRGLTSILSLFCKKFNNFNNTGEWMLEYIIM